MKNANRLSLNKVSKELLFILDILKENSKNYPSRDINWDLFLDLILHHRLYSYIYPRIFDKEEFVPQHVISILNQLYKQNTFKMLHISGELDFLNKIFSQNKIPLIVLKGPVLGKDLYGDISLRTSSDLDVLVPLKQLLQAETILEEKGYVKDDYINTILNDWKWRHHHVTYIHPKKGVKVELHWRLNPGLGKEPKFNELWSRKRVSALTKHPIYILGKEDLFLFLVMHGGRHGWSRLRWLLDIHQLLKQEVSWSFVERLLKRNQCLPIGAQALQLSSQIFNSPLIPSLKKLANTRRGVQLAQKTTFYLENMVNLHTDPVPEDIANYHSHFLFSIMSWQQKCYYLFSIIHPLPKDVETLPLPKWLHFLYFPLRPLLWAKRKVNKLSL
ncbi:nucleotidyltransferase family protein [Bacillus sp. PS06]|uniref:nucleotidyltransferase domain-containing protein n=1 Tax=Bacillus sp. PS06 TaxID=2764176 RepID=UPI00178299A3|nr:nucleotidyltransferase family protein [Bacillus sp. PS06]MBD8071112.1 nucleotidyltransferase family protein [Bacillus sp. PS06]